ncbi:hypothetical protein AVEN_247691-1 [Araneus ventricosus]|uniref:Uncharacterized protein n=1 Tax=Araneus ventricosus TaxID=182803 RepID=A0A4Y2GLM4_ARAVE|nr:hypothetical protein AVEN_247691-1 [Araneus ventricosus]
MIIKRPDKYDVGELRVESQRIVLNSDLPVSLRPYRTSSVEGQEIKSQVQKLLQAGLIKESNSPYLAQKLKFLNSMRGTHYVYRFKSVEEQASETYREACIKLGLLEGDQHWDSTLQEASVTRFPPQLRDLFAIIMRIFKSLRPLTKCKERLSEDILHQKQRANPDIDLQRNSFEDKCLSICGKTFLQLGLLVPTRQAYHTLDRDLLRKANNDINNLQHMVETKKNLDSQKISERLMKL